MERYEAVVGDHNLGYRSVSDLYQVLFYHQLLEAANDSRANQIPLGLLYRHILHIAIISTKHGLRIIDLPIHDCLEGSVCHLCPCLPDGHQSMRIAFHREK